MSGNGEIATASNVGSSGVGIFKEKVGVEFKFKKINALSSRVVITDDTANDKIDIDVPVDVFEAVSEHEALEDPHPQYQRESERDQPFGYAGLDSNGKVSGSKVIYGNLVSTACEGNDSRLSNARTPVAHTHSESEITNLTTDLSSKESSSNKNQANGYAGLDSGSKLNGSQQVYGTTANTACQGNDSRLSDARTPLSHTHAESDVVNLVSDLASKQVTSEKNQPNGYVGLDGSSKINGSYQTYGTIVNTACQGNDSRLSDARTPLTHTHTESEVTNLITDLSNKQNTSAKGAANGYASLDSTTKVPTVQLGGSGADGTKFLRGDQTWAIPSGGGGGPSVVRKSADQSSSLITNGDVTNLVFNVSANTNYSFEFNIFYTAAATTTGLGLAVTVPSAFTNLRYWVDIKISASGAVYGIQTTSDGTTLATSSLATTPLMATVYGTLENGSNAGMIQLRFKSEVSGSNVTILRGSYGILYA